jgi:hypothetical protein
MSWLRSPALHMLAIGGLMFGAAAWRGGGARERPRIEVPRHRLEMMLETFAAENLRPATAEERAAMVEALIDQEVLYRYALVLGMHESSAARRRLAQIAEFVEANPHGSKSEAELADAAMELGLHHGDLVVRRILEDGARRLIRAVVLLQEPTPQSVAAYFEAHRDDFAVAARTRISHVLVNGFKWPDTEARARQILERIRAESLDVGAAVALGDAAFVDADLPELTEQGLATTFGYEFAERVIDLPPGTWSEPIESRYGHHLVWVHERHDAWVPPLQEIYGDAAGRLMEKLADEWLALRLKELRMEFEVVI